jgi:hypothetical protein
LETRVRIAGRRSFETPIDYNETQCFFVIIKRCSQREIRIQSASDFQKESNAELKIT